MLIFDNKCVVETRPPEVTKYWTKYFLYDNETKESFTIAIYPDGRICSIKFITQQ